MDFVRRLEQELESEGLLVKDKFDEWIGLSRSTGQPLDRILTASGYLTEKQMLGIFGRCLQIPLLTNLADFNVPKVFVDRVAVTFARTHNLVAVGEENGTVRVATCSPLDLHPMDNLAAMMDRVVEPVLASKTDITACINRAYQQKGDMVDEALGEMNEDDLAGIAKEVEGSQDLLDIANKAPIIKLVNMIMFQALKMRASDIHLQPYAEKLQVRFRIDGILYDMMSPPKKIQEAVISRIKVMGKMDIAERRLPQDGRASIKVGDSEVDIRISSVPTSHGERIVMRLLDKSARLYKLEEIGLDTGENLRLIRSMINASHGILLVTGPTGSGKSTTLYASLQEINSVELNVMTIEDPIEYQLAAVSQIEVSSKKGLTFAKGLRSIVRQDPDIIMVGEIRDEETAQIAIQSALTGHLVFSTLHTNDAPGAVTRLLDIGVEPFLVSSSVIGVVAQRLVRVICKHCKEGYAPADDELREIGIPRESLAEGKLWKGRGCPHCLNTGYLDRTGIYEVFLINDHVRDQIVNRVSSTVIKQDAVASGMRTLRMDGAEKVRRGVTTVDEVLRMTQLDVL